MLYAPTFRESRQMDVYDIDFYRLKNTLEKKYKCKWKILVRLHPHLINIADKFIGENILNVTNYDDAHEILCITDMLISDYSGISYDYIITGKPSLCMQKI